MEDNRVKKNGPFATAGVILGTVATTATVIEKTVKTSGDVLHQGLTGINTTMEAGVEALQIVTRGALEDLKTDEIVEDAHRRVRVAIATAEAAKVLATLEATPKVEHRTKKAD